MKNDVEKLVAVHPTTVGVTLGQWTHLSLSVKFSGTRDYTLAINDKTPFSAVPLNALLVTGELSMNVGINYTEQAAGRAKVYFDNVRLDYR